jgi:hypothetical protein
MTPRRSALAALGLTALTAVVCRPRLADAGWRPIETLLVDAGDGTDASKGCVDTIARRLREAGEDIALVRKRLDQVAKRLPGTPPASVLDWTETQLGPLRPIDAYEVFDAVIVVDCRPDAHALDVAIDPPATGVTTLRVRALPLDRATLEWVSDRTQSASWAGFEP